jgi:hypothetical protein
MNCKLSLTVRRILPLWGLLLASSPLAVAQTTSSLIQLRALHAEAAQPSVYELTFTAPESIPSETEFVLEFPEGFDLSRVKLASSDEMKGGFTVTVAQQKVLVKRTGLGPSVAAGTRVKLCVGVIVNPSDLSAPQRASVQWRSNPQAALPAAQQHVIHFDERKSAQ